LALAEAEALALSGSHIRPIWTVNILLYTDLTVSSEQLF
jgi:hypothetical protein